MLHQALHIVSCMADLQAAAAVLQAYPPRGTLNLQLSVDKQAVTSLMSGIDRIVVQDYVIDTIHYFDGDNNELARRLGIGRHACTGLLASPFMQTATCLACTYHTYLLALSVHRSCIEVIVYVCCQLWRCSSGKQCQELICSCSDVDMQATHSIPHLHLLVDCRMSCSVH